MNTSSVHDPVIVEDLRGERIMISFGIAKVQVKSSAGGEVPEDVYLHTGQSLLREAADVLLLHQIPEELARKASRDDAMAALILNKSHFRGVARRLCKIVELYNRYDLELFDKEVDTKLVAIGREGVADNVDLKDLVSSMRERRTQ